MRNRRRRHAPLDPGTRAVLAILAHVRRLDDITQRGRESLTLALLDRYQQRLRRGDAPR